MKKILVVGGGGYVGSALTPRLLDLDNYVRVLDTFWYGGWQNIWGNYFIDNPKKTKKFLPIQGDVRTMDLIPWMKGMDVVIYLACISNDPSFDLNPALGRSINYDAFLKVVDFAKKARVGRFIFASSSSVYGVKQEREVTEDLSLEPITDYAKFKAFCEMELKMIPAADLPWVIIRPATICGYAPRLRLDLSVNILTISALAKGKMTIFGGSQKRPNLNIEDMCDLYVRLIDESDKNVIGQTFNAGGENMTILEIAHLINHLLDLLGMTKVPLVITPSDDLRSYHVSSEKIALKLGWRAKKGVTHAVKSLIDAYRNGDISNPEDIKYSNIKTMLSLGVK